MLLFIPLSSCSSTSKEDKAVGKLTKNYAYQMKKEFNLTLIGSGSASGFTFPGELKELILRFKTVGLRSVDEARVLIVKSCQELLMEINTNEDIRPKLSNYPL